ncbi:MAG: RNA methyltransferase, partial [Oceanospirillum sp.]|nr:RNA methyltransferase [Oceanospirillum sp.]
MSANTNEKAVSGVDLLSNVNVVLVNTTHTGNIGGAARAMKNMGLSNLTLVAPKKEPDAEAYARSSRADEILDQAVIVDDLEAAIAGCQLVIGTSARQRNLCWPLITPRQMADEAAQAVLKQPDAKIALVFGREDRGLTNEELALCHFHVNIPTDENFSSLNVAAAVQVLVYELRVKWLELQDAGLPDWQDEWDVDWADAA